jgi:hypothetical protein
MLAGNKTSCPRLSVGEKHGFSRLPQEGPDETLGTGYMTKGVMMKKLALLSMLLGLCSFVTGCGETKPPPKVQPTSPNQSSAPTTEETTAPKKEGDDMPKEGTEPAADEPKATTEEPGTEEKSADAPADEENK